jgi:RNA polymerase sigma factor (sigma-70 family)
MAAAPFTHVLRHVRALAGLGDPTDRRLLERFARQREQAAFAELVRRHGPLVWGVCRRVLRHTEDAEDAFQATFLVLARKAGSTRWRDSIAGWLQEVARRTALKARAEAARRRQSERQAQTMRNVRTDEAEGRELREVIDAEVGRLPEPYREPLLLCCVAGLTNEEAARRLGCPAGTVKSRLARGRDLLRARLLRRGVVVPAGALAALLAGHAAVPSRVLADGTVRAALGFAVARSAATTSPRAAALATEVLRGMAAAPRRAAAVLALGLTMLLAGAGALALPAAPPRPPGESRPPAPAEAPRPDAPLPEGALARLGRGGFRPGSVVYAVALSPDGKRVAAGAYGDAVLTWDTATGDEVSSLRMTGHHWRTSAAFSADGKWLATGDSAGTIRLRGTGGGKTTAYPGGGSSLQAIAFSPDGKTLAAAAQAGTVRLFDPARGADRAACRGHQGEVSSVAWSPDGKTLASAGADGTVRLWDPARAEERSRLTGHNGPVNGVAFSPDGKLLASAGDDRTVRLWDAATGKPVRTLEGHTNQVKAVIFADGGKALFSGGYDNVLRRWDVATGREVADARRPQRGVMCLALSADGKTLASGGWDGVVRLWSAADGKELNRAGTHQDSVAAVALLPGGRAALSVGSDGTLRLWDAVTGRQRQSFEGHQAGAWTAAFSAGGKRLAVKKDERTVALWDADGKEIKTFAPKGHVVCVGLSSGGRYVAAGAADPGAVTLWDATTGGEVCRCAVPGLGPRCLDVSADGKRIATGGHDNRVRVWDVATGKELHRLEGHQRPPDCVAFSPDGRLLATGANEQVVRLWDAAAGKEVRQLPGHGNGVHALAFSADGRTLAAGGWSPVIRLWEVGTGHGRGRFEGHTGAIMSLAFAPDGRTLISGGADTTALLWDLTGRQAGGRLRPAKWTDPELETLWADLAGDDSAKAYRAVWGLAAAPAPALSLLRGALGPAPAPEADRLRRLLAGLDDDDYEGREKATKALEKLGEQAEPELRKALAGKPSAEVRQRCQYLLDRLKPDAPSAERLRQGRALEVLEAMRTPEAKKLLEVLAKGAPQAWLTREAREALGRMASAP